MDPDQAPACKQMSFFPVVMASGIMEGPWPVLLPASALCVTGWWFFRTIRFRSGSLDVFELGIFYCSLVLLYALFPVVSYLLGGLHYSLPSDIRLVEAQPIPSEVGSILWYYWIYLAGFVLLYSWSTRGRSEQPLRVASAERGILAALIFTLIGIKTFFALVAVVFRLQRPEGYLDAYLMYKGLPQILQQILNHLSGMVLVLEILIAIVLVSDLRRYKRWIAVWVAIEAASMWAAGIGSRTSLFVLLFTLTLSYHLLVKRFRIRTIVLSGIVGILLFTVLGIVRNNIDFSGDTQLNPFAYANEFESIFGNAYDVAQLKKAGETRSVYPQFYIADFLAIVPQQIVPFKKVDLAAWYVQTFYPDYADNGGGFAFGAIAESILGLGWIDALWRGAAIGFCFAYVYRKFGRGPQSLWRYAFYVWVLVFSYQCFRATTFALVPRGIYQFLILMVWIRILAHMIAVFDGVPVHPALGPHPASGVQRPTME